MIKHQQTRWTFGSTVRLMARCMLVYVSPTYAMPVRGKKENVSARGVFIRFGQLCVIRTLGVANIDMDTSCISP